MSSVTTERRHAPRRVPDAGEPLSRVRLRTGRELSVVNVSAVGLLVAGPVRLLPGTHVDVHVVTPAGRVLVRSRVVRARVSALQADLVEYQSALMFDRQVETAPAGYGLPVVSQLSAVERGTAYPPETPRPAGTDAEVVALPEVTG
jgi:hypothetical protein